MPRWTTRRSSGKGSSATTLHKASVLPAPLEGDVIELEGRELRVIEVGQGDIAHGRSYPIDLHRGRG